MYNKKKIYYQFKNNIIKNKKRPKKNLTIKNLIINITTFLQI